MAIQSALVATATATALAKSVVDTFITPKFQYFEKYFRTKAKTHLHDYWKNQFTKYLITKYKSYSVMNTIAFNNQQRLLKDLYIPLSVVRYEDGEERFIINDYTDDFLPFFRKIIITDTAGMGKSTITKKMFLSIVDQNSGIPVIIELRRLSKDKTIINEIIEQLSSINKEVDKDFVLDLIDRGDFVFFLDGFDEINPDDKTFVTKDIMDFVRKADNNLFIITSRPEDSLFAFGDFMNFYIKPLTDGEAFELLRKYNNYGNLAEKLIEKIQEVKESVEEFLTNPLLVSLLYTAFEHKHTIPFKKHIFYRQVFDALFEAHDLSKGDSYERSKVRKCSKLDREDFHRVLRYMGYECLKIAKTEFTKDEIVYHLSIAKKFCSDLNFKETDFLLDITTSAPLFSRDGIYYKWSHKSLQEYFAAQFIHLDSKDAQTKLLTKMADGNLVSFYYNILDLYYSIDPKTFRSVVIKTLIKNYISFCGENFVKFSYSRKTVERRSEITFVYSFVIVTSLAVSGTTGRNRNEAISKMVKTALDVIPKDEFIRYSVAFEDSLFHNEHEQIYTLKAPKSYLNLIRLIYGKDSNSFIKKITNFEIEHLKINDLGSQIAIVVDEDSNSILNTEYNFDNITKLLLKSAHSTLVLDLDKSKQYLLDIEKEDQLSNDLMLEDF